MRNYTHLILVIIALTFLSYSKINPLPLTKDKLQYMSRVFDGKLNFIILDPELFPLIQQQMPTVDNVQYYVHDCIKDKNLLKACEESHNTAIMLVYNKVPMEYQVHIKGQTKQQLSRSIIKWANMVANGRPIRNANEEQILNIMREKGQIFILVQNKTIHELETGFTILAKQFAYKDFIYLSDLNLAGNYNLSIGDFVHLKYFPSQEGKALAILVQDSSVTTRLPKQLKRYDMMKLFVLENIMSRGFNKHIGNIDNYRFSLKVRNQANPEQKRIIYVFCDLEVQCLDYMEKLDEGLSKSTIKNDVLFRRVFYRVQTLKLMQILEVYYHVKLRNKKLPFTLILDGEDPVTPYLPLRYAKELQISIEEPINEVEQFLKDIDQNRVPKIQLISQNPKKNGFYGKGSEKNVQKLTFNTYKKALEDAKLTHTYYLMYVTAFDFDCPQCVSFYNEMKKLASFLSGQTDLKIIFGVYDLSKDQIDLKYLNNVPSVLLFSPYQQNPIQYNNRYEFESLHRFLKTEIAKQQEKHHKSQEQL